jgi:hypothetical protein
MSIRRIKSTEFCGVPRALVRRGRILPTIIGPMSEENLPVPAGETEGTDTPRTRPWQITIRRLLLVMFWSAATIFSLTRVEFNMQDLAIVFFCSAVGALCGSSVAGFVVGFVLFTVLWMVRLLLF